MPVSRRRKLTLTVAFLVGAVVGSLSLALMPASNHEVGPATMSAKTRFGGAHTVLAIPPLGTVRAATHPVPMSVDVSLAELDINGVQDIIRATDGQREVRAAIEDDLRGAAIRVGLRTLIVSLIGGAIAGALLPWRKIGDVAAGAAGGLVIAFAAVLSVGATYNVEAFQEPTYSGALRRAPAVLRTLDQQNLTLSALDSRFGTAATRLSELLKLMARPAFDPQADTVAILHVSDIHSNPLGVTVTQELAATFKVDAVVDSGDLTSFGEAMEANVARRLSALDIPYIYVPGNHDSVPNQARLDRIENVHLLHNDTFDVRGITVFGWRDPTYTVWDAIPTEEANELRIQEGEEIASALEAQGDVDVLVVHDKRMAEASESLVPLVLSGHTHAREFIEGDDTDYLTVGSTGATGLEFFIEGSRPYEAQIIYFQEGAAVAVDYVTFESLGEEFEIDRKRLD